VTVAVVCYCFGLLFLPPTHNAQNNVILLITEPYDIYSLNRNIDA
jgi:hypothetical protein